MYVMRKFLVIIPLLTFASLFLFTKGAMAINYELVPPSGQLTRGQAVKFTLNIDTQSTPLTTAVIGLEYDPQYLQYNGVDVGSTFSSVTGQASGNNRVILTGTNATAYNGTGVFAYANFTLIATSAGETQLCALWNPDTNPTPTFTPIPCSAELPCTPTPTPPVGCIEGPSCTSTDLSRCGTGGMCYGGVCRCTVPTSPPVPTRLPRTGNMPTSSVALGIGFVISSIAFYLAKKFIG
jgi:hypothetical protein